MVSLIEQLYAFGITIIGGVAMGVVFDLFRVLRSSAHPRGVLTWVSDILYWVSVTPLVAGLLLHANWGELRFYVVLGIALGLMLYFTLCSPFVLELLLLIWRTVGYVVSLTVHIVWSIVILPVMMVRNVGYAWRAFIGARTRPSPAAPRQPWLRLPWRPYLAWRRR